MQASVEGLEKIEAKQISLLFKDLYDIAGRISFIESLIEEENIFLKQEKEPLNLESFLKSVNINKKEELLINQEAIKTYNNLAPLIKK